MSEEGYRLRAHHIANLVLGLDNGYSHLENGLRNNQFSIGNQKFREYTDKDAERIKNFYINLASKPETLIEIVGGIDDICKSCSNYVGGCALFSEADLHFEDWRSFMEFFPDLKVGDVLPVSKILAYQR